MLEEPSILSLRLQGCPGLIVGMNRTVKMPLMTKAQEITEKQQQTNTT